jgi:hypothetical protein
LTVYPDTSFILSLWHEDDVNYGAASRVFSSLSKETWLWCELHQLEVPIAAQLATHRPVNPLKDHIARTLVFRAERAVTRGGFLKKQLPLESVGFALGLAQAHGWKARHTAIDLWHIGAAWELGATFFATFDERQAGIAKALKFKTNV